ncbi:MAG: hypothetical protein DLM68_03800 [Hyphomicrobiales bacterium]|nr:MAG: hypothetical protein DLM68_03800 [Hyphomicrobiales bacterium]
MPPAASGGPATPFVCKALGVRSGTSCVTDANVAFAKTIENGLPNDFYKYLLTGGTGQQHGVPDARINYDGHDASHLPPGPFQITSKTFPYDAYSASPVRHPARAARPKLEGGFGIETGVDECGSHYDSGYVQPLDSILKFIERNWRLRPITERGQDNLSNPVAAAGNPYVPANSPAIGDLFSMFRCD